MKRTRASWLLGTVGTVLTLLVTMQPAGPQAAQTADATQNSAAASFRPVVDKYCVSCHNERLKTGGLVLEALDMADVAGHADVWEKVIRKVKGNMMPPVGAPRPDAATLSGLVSALATTIDTAAMARPNPGRPLLHRFNRAEYANAIRDLLSLDVDAAVLLPPDDSSYGFDNVADVLGVSPLLMERYVGAAEKISALAVGDMSIPKTEEIYRLPLDFTQTYQVEGLPPGTRGGTLIKHTFPLDGDYVVKVRLWKTSVGFVKGLYAANDIEISLDGKRVHMGTAGGPADYQQNVLNPELVARSIEARLRTRVHVTAGPHDVGATFLSISGGMSTGPEGLRPTLSQHDPLYIDGEPAIERVSIEGPFDPAPPGNTPSRQAIFVCRPTKASDEPACARTILTRLAQRAYRRRTTPADLEPLLRLYASGRQGGTFDNGIELALEGVLANPFFLFRSEDDPAGLAAGAAHPISDVELASRLSFFLWSSLPDEPLMQAALDGRLHEPAVLEQQVRRMLADSRSAALVSNFGGQWLQLRNLPSKRPEREYFDDFDDNLRQSMRRETELLLDSIIRQDHNVLDLLTANYTFVNERLARHYGIPGVYGSQFRQVTLTDPNRFGLLGQASILFVTSFPDRTSPVVRGRWILENILGTPPPAPPPNVPPLPDSAKPRTMRERMEAHRANPACASCHRIMDPLGLSLENFDAVGNWRTTDNGNAIDPATTLADGTEVNGPVSLRAAILRRPDMFVGMLTEKLLTYALGRGLDYYDMAAVRKIQRDAAAQDNRFSSIVLGIVNSVPFRMRTKPSKEKV
jgi:mono/diheme cytochrome c family protein